MCVLVKNNVDDVIYILLLCACACVVCMCVCVCALRLQCQYPRDSLNASQTGNGFVQIT